MRAASSNLGIWVLGLGGAAALFFLGKKAAAAGTPAAAERTARVLQSVNTRSAPDATKNNIIGAPNTAPNDAIAGATVRVLRTKISGPGAREWWEIITPSGGRGFAAAIGADGSANLQLL